MTRVGGRTAAACLRRRVARLANAPWSDGAALADRLPDTVERSLRP